MNRTLQFDGLESRNLLSGSSPTVSYVQGFTGTLAVIQGTEGNDKIEVNQATDGSLTAVLNGEAVALDSSVRYLYITGAAGNDQITNNTSLETVIHGGAGNDKLVAGSGFDYLFGDEGNDKLTGDPFSDYLEEDTPFPNETVPVLGGEFVVLYGTEGDDNVLIEPSSRGEEGESSVFFDGGEVFVRNYQKVIIDVTGAGNDIVERNTDAITVVVLDNQ